MRRSLSVYVGKYLGEPLLYRELINENFFSIISAI